MDKKRIELILKASGLRKNDFAKKVGVSRRALHYWLTEVNKPIGLSLDSLIKLEKKYIKVKDNNGLQDN